MNAIAELTIKTPNFDDDFDNHSLTKQTDEQISAEKSIEDGLNERNREHMSTILII